MIVAPALPSVSFDPVLSRCQSVLNKTRTGLPPVCSATTLRSSGERSGAPPFTISAPSGPLRSRTFEPAPRIREKLSVILITEIGEGPPCGRACAARHARVRPAAPPKNERQKSLRLERVIAAISLPQIVEEIIPFRTFGGQLFRLISTGTRQDCKKDSQRLSESSERNSWIAFQRRCSAERCGVLLPALIKGVAGLDATRFESLSEPAHPLFGGTMGEALGD